MKNELEKYMEQLRSLQQQWQEQKQTGAKTELEEYKAKNDAELFRLQALVEMTNVKISDLESHTKRQDARLATQSAGQGEVPIHPDGMRAMDAAQENAQGAWMQENGTQMGQMQEPASEISHWSTWNSKDWAE